MSVCNKFKSLFKFRKPTPVEELIRFEYQRDRDIIKGGDTAESLLRNKFRILAAI